MSTTRIFNSSNLGTALLTTLALLFTGIPVVAEDTPVCYLQTQSGRIFNLDNLCSGGDTQPIKDSLSPTEQQFLEDLKRSLHSSPEAQTSADPQAAIRKAQEICNALEAGTFLDYRQAQTESLATQTNPSTQRITNSQNRAIQTLAPKHFCPAFDN